METAAKRTIASRFPQFYEENLLLSLLRSSNIDNVAPSARTVTASLSDWQTHDYVTEASKAATVVINATTTPSTLDHKFSKQQETANPTDSSPPASTLLPFSKDLPSHPTMMSKLTASGLGTLAPLNSLKSLPPLTNLKSLPPLSRPPRSLPIPKTEDLLDMDELLGEEESEEDEVVEEALNFDLNLDAGSDSLSRISPPGHLDDAHQVDDSVGFIHEAGRTPKRF